MAFKLRIITPERLVFEGEADYLSVPGVEGEFGVLSQHAATLAGLKTDGVLTYHVKGQDHKVTITGGFVEIQKNTVSVLADAVTA